MVVYQIMLTLCSSSAYFIDGSGFSFDQVTCSHHCHCPASAKILYPAHTWLIMSWQAVLQLIVIFIIAATIVIIVIVTVIIIIIVISACCDSHQHQHNYCVIFKGLLT